jgi:hypothetical protein
MWKESKEGSKQASKEGRKEGRKEEDTWVLAVRDARQGHARQPIDMLASVVTL